MAEHFQTLSKILPKILKDRFGYSEFRPGQMDVLQALSEHGKALAVFPIGGGKSLCYQLPALTWDGITIVVSPLIALMKDQIDFLKNRPLRRRRSALYLGMGTQLPPGLLEAGRYGTRTES